MTTFPHTAPRGKGVALDSGTRVVLATEYIDKTVDTERSILSNALIFAHHLLFARIKDLLYLLYEWIRMWTCNLLFLCTIWVSVLPISEHNSVILQCKWHFSRCSGVCGSNVCGLFLISPCVLRQYGDFFNITVCSGSPGIAWINRTA